MDSNHRYPAKCFGCPVDPAAIHLPQYKPALSRQGPPARSWTHRIGGRRACRRTSCGKARYAISVFPKPASQSPPHGQLATSCAPRRRPRHRRSRRRSRPRSCARETPSRPRPGSAPRPRRQARGAAGRIGQRRPSRNAFWSEKEHTPLIVEGSIRTEPAFASPAPMRGARRAAADNRSPHENPSGSCRQTLPGGAQPSSIAERRPLVCCATSGVTAFSCSAITKSALL